MLENENLFTTGVILSFAVSDGAGVDVLEEKQRRLEDETYLSVAVFGAELLQTTRNRGTRPLELQQNLDMVQTERYILSS